jgi:hypothetical protein
MAAAAQVVAALADDTEMCRLVLDVLEVVDALQRDALKAR